MRVAFVGVKRKYSELSSDYVDFFNQYHLELPHYFAKHGPNDVTITTVDHLSGWKHFENTGAIRCEPESNFLRSIDRYEVVVHWRKWFPEFYRPEAINVINCQDHSFSSEWIKSVQEATRLKQLHGILCFPKWHEDNLSIETEGYYSPKLISGLTLGVDTEVYKPSEDKNKFHMLWASDPGRGLTKCLELAIKLFSVDKRFRLNVCYPDYCGPIQPINHPAIIWHGNVSNGPKLWNLFNSCGILPYTSNFKEPSSRAHRQAMAAASLVLYPPSMGTPSELIQSATTGIVSPICEFTDHILTAVNDGSYEKIGKNAREYAISENWEVQAKRFNEYFSGIISK